MANKRRSYEAIGAAVGTALVALTTLVSQAALPRQQAKNTAQKPSSPPAPAPKPVTGKPTTAAKSAPKRTTTPVQVAAAKPGNGKLRYNQDIRPILAENCFACHGPDSASRKAGLRLDRFADATARRDLLSAIKPGDPINSEVVRRILKPSNDYTLMPPADSHKKLTEEQKATLIRWIDEGAEYEPHWSYIAPKRPALPAVKNTAWVRNPIDRFILAKLEASGLTPAPEADRRTLARRLSLDLTGLPPDPADVEAFVNDKSPNAYEKLVDKYIASPQWGEHRGRYWLDAARFADTHGIHFDNYREMWSYRDWVINAFNKNMRFDEFTIEQLAGDLLPNPTLDQRIATGFNRNNITTNEGGAIAEEYNVLYTRDRTETAAQVFLASTAGCAVCHDHKFDPLSQKEFYSLAAFFNNTTQNAMDGNIKDTPPIVPVPMPADRPRFEALKGEIAEARKQMEDRKTAARPDFDKWLSTADAKTIAASVPTEGLKFHLPLAEGTGNVITGTLDGQPLTATAIGNTPGWDTGYITAKAFQKKPGSVLEFANIGDFEKDQSFTYAAWVKLPNGNTGGAIISRMDDKNDFRGWDIWLEGNRVGSHIINKWPDNALKAVTREPLKAGKWQHVCITYSGGGKQDSLRIYVDGVQKDMDVSADTLKDSIRTNVPFRVGQRNTTSPVENTSIQDVRLYSRALSSDEAGRLATGTRAAYLASRAVSKVAAAGDTAGAAPLTPAEKDELFAWWLNGSDESYRTLSKKIANLQDEDSAIRMRGTIAHVSQEKAEEAMAFVLFRGEYDKRREKVVPATPAALPVMPANLPKNRLGFAKWLLLPEHPLTTRVTVNRFWQELFGQGLVRTSGDFGISGELPSHPELLDWMAVEFREKGWDMKRFFKMLVMSATYRQSATITPEKRAKDGANRLLSCGPRFRMDAEMVRDYALAASGLMVKKIGGPSVKPYQPDGVWEAVAMIGSNTRDYRRDTGESLYRRSMYTFWKRAAPPASMEIFNAPNRETCAVRRERTNTPLQALVTMNDPQFVEAARYLAQRAIKNSPTMEGRFDFIAQRLLGRPVKVVERGILEDSLGDLMGYYALNPKDGQALVTVGESKPDATIPADQLAAWTMLTNQMMNLDEVLNK
jgi:cytochrome c553